MSRQERWTALYRAVVYDPDADPVILVNKAGIRDFATLEKFEREQVKDRAIQPPPSAALAQTSEGLRALHHHLFQDVYDWAGEYRSYPTSRGQHFSLPEYISGHTDLVFRGIQEENALRGLPPDQFAARAAHYVNRLNSIHPFIDGNGRTQRTWLRHTADAAGYRIRFREGDRGPWNDASMLGHLTADNPQSGYKTDDPMALFILSHLEYRDRDRRVSLPRDADQLANMYQTAAANIRQELSSKESHEHYRDAVSRAVKKTEDRLPDRDKDRGGRSR